MKNPVITAMVGLLAVAGTAFAAEVQVDFSGLNVGGIDYPVDITAENNPAGITLNGVNFLYDNYLSTADFAIADAGGIWGTTLGPLMFTFAGPVSGLRFDYAVLGAAGADPNSLAGLFSRNGAWIDSATMTMAGDYVPYDPADPALGDIVGHFSYAGPVFDSSAFYFSPVSDAGSEMPVHPDPYYFTVSNIAYTPAVVPEPVSSTLFLVGGGALAALRRRKTQVEKSL
jgi:hypothetical protein